METLPFNRRATLVEYVLVAWSVALLGTVYLFGDFGTNSERAAFKASYQDAQSEYASPLISGQQLMPLRFVAKPPTL